MDETSERTGEARQSHLTLSRRGLLKGMVSVGAAAASTLPAAGTMAASPAVVPFRYQAPQAALDDLKVRLDRTRFPEREPVDDWSQGVPLAKLRALVDYWRRDYDWRRCEAWLKGFEQFKTEIDGLGIHFLHVRSPQADAMPMLLTHGWPGSVIEFFKVIGPLTDPTAHGGTAADAFHLVVPSLPGFGFSDKPRETGWNSVRIARAWGELMQRLGYRRYVAQGGDWGADVTTKMAQQHTPGLAAIHLNMPLVFPEEGDQPRTEEERQAVEKLARFQSDGFGYFLLQSTRPQTVGYALTDSPAGLAAWIYEKFHAWTDNRGNPEDALSADEMLDNITLYWLTETAASSARIYHENEKDGFYSGVVDLPVGVSIFPDEIVPAPRSWADRVFPNLIHWRELDRGGHFAAFEEPDLFVEELRTCFRSMR